VAADPRRPAAPPARRICRRRRRRLPLTAQAADVAGRSIATAVPLHRLDPRLVNGAGVAEIGAFGAYVATTSVVAFAGLVLASVVFVTLHLADERVVLAVHDDGEATLLSAGRSGRPVAVRAGARRPPELPELTGLAASVGLDGTRWWIDRSAYGLLQAGSATPPA